MLHDNILTILERVTEDDLLADALDEALAREFEGQCIGDDLSG